MSGEASRPRGEAESSEVLMFEAIILNPEIWRCRAGRPLLGCLWPSLLTQNHRRPGVPVLHRRPLCWRAAWLVIGTPLPIPLHSPAAMSVENNILSPQGSSLPGCVLPLGSFSPLLSTR